MIGTFGYLLLRSARNRLARQIGRLRQPRYLAALALGVAYLWWIIVEQRPRPPAGEAARAELIELGGALALAAATGWAWLFATERRVLAFSPAEVTFLFTGPVTRRQLIHFKLLRTQLVILLNTLLWTLLLSRDAGGLPALLRAGAVWLILTTLSLHRLGASFVRSTLAEHGASGVRRRVVSLFLLGVAVVALGWMAVDAAPSLAAGWNAGIGAFLATVAGVLERPLPSALLLPFRLLAAPLAATSAGEWLRAVGPAAALLVAHYVWVVRSDSAFEEAAAEESLRRAERLAGGRRAPRAASARRRAAPPYPLAPVGRPAGAILWKNLVMAVRGTRVRAIALGFLAGGVLLGALSFQGDGGVAEVAGWFVAMWSAFLVAVGPQWVRNDLRGDLPKLDLLRSYPLRGGPIVAAEVAASTCALTALQLGMVAVAYLAFLGNRTMEPGLGARSALLLTAVVLLPAVNLLGLLIQNGAAILYPSWVRLGAGRPGGIEALGQNMLAIIAHLLVLGVGLIGPAGAAIAVLAGLTPLIGWWAGIPAAVAAAIVIGMEAAVAIRWLGAAFERTDPATVPSA